MNFRKQNGSKAFAIPLSSVIQHNNFIPITIFDCLLLISLTPDICRFFCFSTSGDILGIVQSERVVKLYIGTIHRWVASASSHSCSSVGIIPKMHSWFLGPSAVGLLLCRCTLAPPWILFPKLKTTYKRTSSSASLVYLPSLDFSFKSKPMLPLGILVLLPKQNLR